MGVSSGVTTADLGSLEPGTHLCALRPDRRELDRVAATFVTQGLSAGDRVMYVAADDQADVLLDLLPAPLRAADALATGQLAVSSFAGAYGAHRPDDLRALADGFRAAAGWAREAGFPGLRVAARMDELPGLLGSAEEALCWEHRSTEVQREIGVSSVCLYDSTRLEEAHAALIADAHAGSAPELAEDPLATFLAVDEPWGLRVSGEVDISNRDLLQRLLLSRVAVAPRVRLDLADLAFADVGTLARLRSVAAGLPDEGWLALERAPAAVRRVIALAGLGHRRLRVEP